MASGKLSWQLFHKLLEVPALEFPLLCLINVRPKRQMTHMKNCGFQITDLHIEIGFLFWCFHNFFFPSRAVHRIIEQFGLERPLKVI